MIRRILIGLVVVVVAIWAWNSSLLAPAQSGATKLIAHRGVHQTFHRDGLTSDTCTAERIYPPTHRLMENTIDSMQAAFDAGADAVELDVHLTPDFQFAVFHDWTLDCRTEGQGVTEETPMAEMRGLDLGYGYTADGGATFPLRGLGIGLMPALDEVFVALPGRQFLINYKSRRAEEGTALVALIAAHPEWRESLFGAYGGAEPSFAAADGIEGLKAYSNRSAADCLIRYELLGWTGFVPEACRNTYVLVPGNFAWALWGWPNRFAARMRDAGSQIILLGPYEAGDPGTRGIDSAEEVSLIPANFDGYVWTNRIEIIGPMLKDGTTLRMECFELGANGGEGC